MNGHRIKKIQNLKYTNHFIFEKRERERERLLSEDSKGKESIHSLSNHSHLRNNSEFPLVSNYATLTTMNSSIRALSTVRGTKTKKVLKSNMNSVINLNIFDNLNSSNSKNYFNITNSFINGKTNSNFYMTDIPFKTIYTDKKIKSYKDFSSDDEKEEKEKYNLKLLNIFEKNNSRNKIKQQLFSKTLIDFKVNKLNQKKESINDAINKTRDMILNKYTKGIKKERIIRLKEVKENNLDRVENIITSMKNTNKLFNDTFLQKFNDYVRELEIQRELAKTENINLMEEILKHKNEISQLESQIRKIEYEKNNIVRWIFFQILVKEKKIYLPSYYKSIIEETEENMKKILSNPANFSCEDNELKRQYKRQLTKKKFERRSTRKSFASLEKILTSRATTITIYKNITIEEAKRVRDYKYHLCYNTPEEFFERIKQFEFDILKSIKIFDKINLQIRELKIEREDVIKEQEYELKIENEDIQEKENLLKTQKIRFEILDEEINNLKELLKTSQLKPKIKRNKTRRSIFDNSFHFTKKKISNLYVSICNIFHTCSQPPLNEIIESGILIVRRINSKESEMIDMLLKIEMVIDYLLTKINVYKNNKDIYADLYKKIQSDIEKNKKIEKTRKQKEEESNKLNKLKERIQKRDNKIYFLPRRKFERNFSSENIKHQKKIIKDPTYINPGFFDFVYDTDDEINNKN